MLIGANLTKTNLSGADLTHAILTHATLTDVKGLTPEMLESAHLKPSDDHSGPFKPKDPATPT